jgi:hypothetical protein
MPGLWRASSLRILGCDGTGTDGPFESLGLSPDVHSRNDQGPETEIGSFCHTDHGVSGHAGGATFGAPPAAAHQFRGIARQQGPKGPGSGRVCEQSLYGRSRMTELLTPLGTRASLGTVPKNLCCRWTMVSSTARTSVAGLSPLIGIRNGRSGAVTMLSQRWLASRDHSD